MLVFTIVVCKPLVIPGLYLLGLAGALWLVGRARVA